MEVLMTATRYTEPPRVRSAFARSLGKWLAIGATVVALFNFGLPHLFGALSNPFTQTTVDHSGPALLQALSNMSRYEAASGRFEVVIDLEKDAKYMPSALRGERTTYLAVGTVNAGVDLSGLDAAHIVSDPAAKAATITVPHATLSAVMLDATHSKVLSHKRGLLDRMGQALGDAPATKPELFKVAEQRLRAAAVASDVRTTAEANTRTMLTNLVQGLGFTSVTVVFQNPVALGPAAPKVRRNAE